MLGMRGIKWIRSVWRRRPLRRLGADPTDPSHPQHPHLKNTDAGRARGRPPAERSTARSRQVVASRLARAVHSAAPMAVASPSAATAKPTSAQRV